MRDSDDDIQSTATDIFASLVKIVDSLGLRTYQTGFIEHIGWFPRSVLLKRRQEGKMILDAIVRREHS